ncbi:MAG TPA: EAL domain-containing protein [bacterium]|nr:EAL domain-containing protein [bacterium]
MNNETAGANPGSGNTEIRARQQAVMTILGQRALSSIDVSTFMSEAVASIARLLRVQYCNVLERIPGTQTFRLCAGVGWTEDTRNHASVDGGPTSQAGYTLLSSTPVIVEDYRTEVRFQVPALVHRHPLAGGMSVAIPGRDRPFGVLAVATTTPRTFSEEDATFLQGVATVFAAAIERRRTHDSAQETNQQLRALADTAPLAIVSLDLNGTVQSWNAAAERVFGWIADEVLGQPDPLFFDHGRGEGAGVLERVLRGETIEEFAAQIQHKDGRPVDVSISATPVYDGTGSVDGVIALIADRTAHRQIEAAQAQLAEIIETTTDFVTITDVPGKGFYVNRAGRRMLGIGGDEDISTMTFADVFSGDTWSFISNEAMPAAVRDGGWSGEIVLFNKDGQEIPVSMVMIAHKGEHGHVEFFSAIARDISERKQFEHQLVRLANHDPLTDLFNRRRLEEEVERHLAEARRYGIRGALLFVDLDQFKDVNDSLGHPTGDALLVHVAGSLRERLRETDIIARMGGDEFAILLPHTDKQEAEALAAQLVEALRKTTIDAAGRPVGVTASVGIALFPEHATTLGDLFARADLAMYQAKESGRNQCGVYEPERDWQAASHARLSWQRRIREALERNQFTLQAQPILDLRAGRISHYELLVRMVGEKGEIIPPGAFLDIAERFGLIQAIDRWVVRRAIRLLAAHHRTGRDLSLVVNVSSKGLADADLLPMIKQELGGAAVDPRRLVLEITETAAITNIYQAEKFVNTLQKLGCRVGLDDFGVGFTSFYHLKHLPVDYFKIDGSFIRELPRDQVDQQLVRAMVAVARGLEKETVAEFVTDAETVRLLREYGVDYAQGFHVGADAGEEIVFPEGAAAGASAER